MIWSKQPTSFDWWEVEIQFRVTGRGRVGADGLAFWYSLNKGFEGPVSDMVYVGLLSFINSYLRQRVATGQLQGFSEVLAPNLCMPGDMIHLVMLLHWIDIDLDVSPSCPAASDPSMVISKICRFNPLIQSSRATVLSCFNRAG